MTPEQKRHATLTAVTRELTDRGKLIEAGWVGLQLASIPADAPQVQLDEMRNAFFAGAHHVFASIMTMLEPGAEPTDADTSRLSQIDAELQGFIADFSKRHGLGLGGERPVSSPEQIRGRLQPGSVVQIDPDFAEVEWCRGQMVIVREVRPWGVVGDVPSVVDGEAIGYPIRVPDGCYRPVGLLPWPVRERVEVEGE